MERHGVDVWRLTLPAAAPVVNRSTHPVPSGPVKIRRESTFTGIPVVGSLHEIHEDVLEQVFEIHGTSLSPSAYNTPEKPEITLEQLSILALVG